MIRLLPVLLAVPLLLSYGVAEGIWTDRWHHSHAVEDAAAKLSLVPANVGEWESQTEEIDPRQAIKAELSGSLLRRYVHRVNGSVLTVHLLCGRPGPVSVHTPDVCFVGSGYALTEKPVAQSLRDDPSARLNVGVFRRGEDTIAEYYRTLWGWSFDGKWSAPANPRLEFARAPALYKLYVVRQMARPDEPFNDDPIQDFLGLFLPQLRSKVFTKGD